MIQPRQDVAKRWAEEGFSCDLWVDPPGQKWEDFIHDVDEMVFVIEGTMEFEINGRKRILKPGDEVFIPAGSTHSARNKGKITARWYYGYRI